ncbi:helix-turn-helix domain-containing protein [Pseudoalteromonas arctica]|uniref:LysR family transcriptional regulator n=1 Tax=Pseudoalteromonas arctica TaxID=394751 RepID=A0A7Y0DT56_9GAMM|nr:LysR family transcriptional regulator [Pseudoalteromonas arctica]
MYSQIANESHTCSSASIKAETFCTFVETGSFTRAAQQVCRTQSAVSMQMKKHEQELDNPLFVKQG